MALQEGFFPSGTAESRAPDCMESLIAAYPWQDTPLGASADWPQGLKVVARLLLNSRHPMFVWWGPELIQLYNDAYRDTMSTDRHPVALGASGRDTWADIWSIIGPQIDYVMAGRGATWHEDQLVPTTREGQPRDIYWTYGFSPIDDDTATNGVGGVLVICRDTTHEVIARQHTEARYQNLFAAVGEGFCIIQVLFNEHGRAIDYVFLETNPAFVVQTGMKQAVGKTMRSMIPDLEPHWFTAFGHVALTGEPLWHEFEAAPLGRWYDVHAFRIDHPADYHVAVVFNDSTGRREAAQRLRDYELRFRAFVTASSDVVYRMSPDWAQMHQLEGQGFLADRVRPDAEWMESYIDPADRLIVAERIKLAIQDKSMFELEHRVRRADGSLGWTLSRAIPILSDDGTIVEWLGAASDVTQHHQAIEALRQSEERNRRIVEGIEDYAVFVTDAAGIVVDWTPAAVTVFGWAREDIIGSDMAILFTPEDRAVDLPASERAIARDTGCANDNRWHQRRDGRRFLATGTLRPLRDADGSISGFIKVARDDTEKLATQAALAASQTLTRYVFDRLPTGLVVGEVVRDATGKGTDWRYVDVNPAWEKLVGVPRAAALDRTVTQVFPDVESAWIDDFVRVVDTGAPLDFEAPVGALDRWFEGHCFRVSADRFAMSFLDVTARRHGDTTLQALHADLEARFAERTTERNLLATLVDTTDTFIQVVDLDYYFLAINRASATEFERLFGVYPRIGDNMLSLLDHLPDQQAAVRALWSRALAGEEYTVSASFEEQAGTRYYEIRFNALRDSHGNHYGAYQFVHDVTERHRDQARLEENDARLRTVFETSDRLQALLTTDGAVLDANAALLAAIGAPLDDVLGRMFFDIPRFAETVSAPETLRAAVTSAAKGVAMQDAMTLATASGQHTYDLSMRPISDARGRAFAIALDAIDITERLKIEEALRQSQKVEALGQLTGGIAHDFNNHLTVIRSSVELLRRTNVTEERRQHYLSAISNTSDRAAKLTGQLLAFARRQALSPEVFDVGARVDGLADMLRSLLGARITLAVEISNGPWYVEADTGQFDNAMINLAVNARDAMDGAGTLTVRIDQADSATLPHASERTGATWIAIAITDTGCGIPPDNLDRIFEPFFTTKRIGKGTGLGLSQLIGFARQSGGDVTVRSVMNTGTTFTLCLRQATAQPAAMPPPAAVPVLTDVGRTGHVLIVEDNNDIGENAANLLADLGFETTLRSDAESALALLEHEHHRFDLVFSDIVMPGMGGVELGHAIRKRWPGLPVILTSGYSHVLADDGRHGFLLLHKPYSLAELSQIFEQALSAAQ